jgi:hypothetical protein
MSAEDQHLYRDSTNGADYQTRFRLEIVRDAFVPAIRRGNPTCKHRNENCCASSPSYPFSCPSWGPPHSPLFDVPVANGAPIEELATYTEKLTLLN